MVMPTVVLMNPPFSASPNVKGGVAGTDLRHLRSALLRLAPGGRLVAITGANLSPRTTREAFVRSGEHGRVVFTAPSPGSCYRRHGTTVETRLTVIDRTPDAGAPALQVCHAMADSAQRLCSSWSSSMFHSRTSNGSSADCNTDHRAQLPCSSQPGACRQQSTPADRAIADPGVPLAYTVHRRRDTAAAVSSDALYEPYCVETIRIDGAKPHPTQLVQSAAMASVRPPKPTYRPHAARRASSREGLLSDAQLESVIYAGEAQPAIWPAAGASTKASTCCRRAARRRRDGGCVPPRLVPRRRHRGRQGPPGRRHRARQLAAGPPPRAVDLQIRQADRGRPARLVGARPGEAAASCRRTATGRASRSVSTKASCSPPTRRCARPSARARPRASSRSSTGSAADFDGVIMFDEAHAMANAAGEAAPSAAKGAVAARAWRGCACSTRCPMRASSTVSATGATTVENLAYAQRLGLWGGDDFPFANRAEFVTAMEQGGIASMEVLARDLKALGPLRLRASLSYEGVEVDILEHALTPEQIRIYDAYAGAFQVIHHNLDAALKAANVTSEDGAR